MADMIPTSLEQLVTDIKYVLKEIGREGATVSDALMIVEQANRVYIVDKDATLHIMHHNRGEK